MFFAHSPWEEDSISLGNLVKHFIIFGETFFDVMDNLSSKYMLPIGGMFTAIFILMKWTVPSFINEIGQTIIGKDEDKNWYLFYVGIAAIIVGFIIINEIIAKITGNAIIG